MEAYPYSLKWAIILFFVIGIIFNLFIIINLISLISNFTLLCFENTYLRTSEFFESNSIKSTVTCLSSAILPALPSHNLVYRDKKGRFRSPDTKEQLPLILLNQEVMDPLVGNLLGDGSLRFTHKGEDGKPKPGCNASYAMTLKRKDYTYHLWSNIYSTIYTSTLPRP